MRRIALIILLCLLTASVALGITTSVLAANGSLHPGSGLYSLQYLAEQLDIRLFTSVKSRAERYLVLARRRVEDLKFVSGTERELQALVFLNASIDQAADAVAAAADAGDWTPVSEFSSLGAGIQIAADGLLVLPEEYPKLNGTFQDKIITLKMLAGAARTQGADLSRLNMVALPFPPEAAKFLRLVGFFTDTRAAETHNDFPLLGRHVLQSCETCHSAANSAPPTSDCQSCHKSIRPANHFEGSCVSCHSPILWTSVHFDHTLARAADCLSCHLDRRPENHFQAQCSYCHSVNTFKGAQANHELANATDCITCHLAKRPVDHFEAQCSTCHSTKGWNQMENIDHAKVLAAGVTQCSKCHSGTRPAEHVDIRDLECIACHNTTAWKPLEKMDHLGAQVSNCLSCHTDSRPAGHIEIGSNQCSACHDVTAWKPLYRMDHAVLAAPVNCLSCHGGSKPAGHVNVGSAQCSSCHNTSAWKPLARMDHNLIGSAANCQSCHLNRRPANHYAGQCSLCHTTSSWRGATFNHAGATDCQSCHLSQRPANHYAGQCSLCHQAGTSWSNAAFNHSSATTDCQSCHKRPSNHYSGQCSLCHVAGTTWSNANFNHSGQTDCQSCHVRPANHYSGQCSLCHVAGTTWSNATFNHDSIGSTDCSVCHANRRPSTHFSGACSNCHIAGSWTNIKVPSGHTFPVYHKNANGDCAKCHPSLTEDWTCGNCHDLNRIDQQHSGVNGYSRNCIACHPTGGGGDAIPDSSNLFAFMRSLSVELATKQ